MRSLSLSVKGLSKFYEQTNRWNEYGETLKTMIDMYARGYVLCFISSKHFTYFLTSDDAVKCAEVLQKYIELRRQQGTRKDVGHCLFLVHTH